MTEEEAEAALELHEQQRQTAWSKQPHLLSAPEQVFHEWKGERWEVKRRPGRQEAFRNRNNRTFQSREAANFIHEEMEIFRQQNCISRVPKLVRNRFWEIAKARYPAADEAIVWDHVRMNRKRF